MKPILSTTTVISLLLPLVVFAESVDEQNELTLPGDENGTAMPSDGLAECAAILAAAASKSTNIVYRSNMKNSSANWFATSGDLAIEEGSAHPEDEVWVTKVTEWSERIGSVDAMAQHGEWMAYCTELGEAQQLDVTYFSVELEPEPASEIKSD